MTPTSSITAPRHDSLPSLLAWAAISVLPACLLRELYCPLLYLAIIGLS
jgi:hypothetical protein